MTKGFYYNLSEMVDPRFMALAFLDPSNATIWEEGGWVHAESDDIHIPAENMSLGSMGLEISETDEYTEYRVQANISEIRSLGDQLEGFNLTDWLEELLLGSMVFEFTVEMPGEVVDTNAELVVMIADACRHLELQRGHDPGG